MSEHKIPIPGRIYNASGGNVCGTDDIIDDAKGKKQSQINNEVDSAIQNEIERATEAENDRYTKNEVYSKEETYNKNELNNLITTPSQEYVTVVATDQTTAATDVLPATGEADTIYRVGNWDGSQYDESVYTEYAWNGSAYVPVGVKSQVGEVYDISLNHAGATYADLTAALGTNGANIPESLRKGGMSVKYVQSSDNKYVQYRLMNNQFSTTVSDWQGVDDEPTAGSENLVKSGGVAKLIERVENPDDKYINATIDKNKKIIEAVGKDGIKHLFGGFTNEAKIHKCDNNPEFVEALLDSNNKILESISKNGKKTFYGDVEIKGIIHTNGFDEDTLLEIKESVISKNAFLRLPDTLHICQGLRSPIYAHEMIAGDYSELYHVNDQYDNFLSPFLNVGKDNVGTLVRNIQIRDSQGVVNEKALVIDTFANPSTEVSLKILQFGDSKSENKSKFAELMNLLQKDGNKITITWLGNRTSSAKDSDGNIHTITNQAVSGTALFDYLTSSDAWNIFYDANLDSGVNITARLETKPVKFSIAKAIETLGVVPDIVWCDHGANESWDYYFPDSTIIACYDYLINDIKAYNQAHNTNIKLVISDQEGSGLSETINGGIGKNVSMYWRKLRLYTNRIQNRESEGIYLCPNWLFVDLYNDFPMANVPTNSCNKQLRKIVVDTIHCGKNVGDYSSSQQYNYGDVVGVGENMYVCVNETSITNIEPNDDKVNWAQVIPDSISVGYWHIGYAYYHTLKYIVSRDY